MWVPLEGKPTLIFISIRNIGVWEQPSTAFVQTDCLYLLPHDNNISIRRAPQKSQVVDVDHSSDCMSGQPWAVLGQPKKLGHCQQQETGRICFSGFKIFYCASQQNTSAERLPELPYSTWFQNVHLIESQFNMQNCKLSLVSWGISTTVCH